MRPAAARDRADGPRSPRGGNGPEKPPPSARRLRHDRHSGVQDDGQVAKTNERACRATNARKRPFVGCRGRFFPARDTPGSAMLGRLRCGRCLDGDLREPAEPADQSVSISLRARHRTLGARRDRGGSTGGDRDASPHAWSPAVAVAGTTPRTAVCCSRCKASACAIARCCRSITLRP
jgi:hypothetical protein